MTVYATRLVNGTDTRERMRRADALHMFASGPGMARGGLRPDGGGAVTVNAGTMTVNVSAFTAWVDGGVSDLQGGYTFVSDATEVLTVAAGHASLSRTDVVIAEVRDTTHDASGSTDARVRILQGTAGAGVPALPTNAVALRDITVPAGLSVGTGGLAAGNLSTDRRTYTTGLGGVLTVASQAERDALPQTAGTAVYRTDTDALEVRRASGWDEVAASIATGTSSADPNISYGAREVGRVGRVVDFDLECTFNIDWPSYSWAVTVIPVGFRPRKNIEAFFYDTSGGGYPCMIQPDGQVIARKPIPTGTTILGTPVWIQGG